MAIRGNVKTREGIVLRKTTYKESDAMIKAIDENGFFSFLAHGVFKMNSKNSGAVQELSHGVFSLREGKSGGTTLSESKVIDSYFDPNSDYPVYACYSFALELINRCIMEDEASSIYPWLKRFLDEIKAGFHPLTGLLILFANVLKIHGIGLEVDECVICHEKRGISAISMRDGGFLCLDHIEAGDGRKMTSRELSIIRYIFKVQIEDFTHISFEDDESISLIRFLTEYLDYSTGLSLKSIKFIETI